MGRINWDQGRAIDDVIFARDGKSAQVSNRNANLRFNARRAADIAAHPVDPHDPLLGTWQWFQNKWTVTFNADGTCRASTGMSGLWQFNGNPEVQRKYRLVWGGGKLIDNLTLLDDGKAGRLVNQKGDRFNVHRAQSF